MSNKNNRVEITLTSGFFITVAASLVLIPLNWLLAWSLAVIVHEFSHYLAIKICGGCIYSVCIGYNGAVMNTEPLSPGKECISAAAGPIGGMLLLLFATHLPRVAVCAFIQSVFNLLPLFPLDGGRIVGCLIRWLFSEDLAAKIVRIIQNSTVIIIIVLCLLAALKFSLGLLPILIVTILLFKNKNLLAKRRGNEYNMNN